MTKKYAIGIDLGGTSVKYALIDNEGVFHFQGKLPSKADISAEAVIGQLVTACKETMASAQQLGVTIEGIGIGTPGIVDETNRIVLGGAENIKGWENLNLANRIEAETHLPVQMGNDANLMGLGETMYGAGQGARNVVFLTVGTGIGGAVVIDGKLFNGFANRGDVVHTAALGFIQQVVFAPGGLDGKFVGCGHIVHGLRRDTRRIDDIARFHNSGGGGQCPAAGGLFDVGHRAAAVQLHAVAHSHFCHCQRKLPRADDGGAGRIQRANDSGGQIRFHGKRFLCGKQPDARHAVGDAVLIQFLQVGQLFRAEGQHQTAALQVRHIQTGADLLGQCRALHVEPCHPGARFGVVASVQNGTVGLGGAVCHVIFSLENGGLQRVMGQLIGGCRTNDTAADNCYIQHKNLLIAPFAE